MSSFREFNQGGLSTIYKPNLSTLTVSGRDGELGVYALPHTWQTFGTSEWADIAQKLRLDTRQRFSEELLSTQFKRVLSIPIKVISDPIVVWSEKNVESEFLEIENQIKAALELAPLEDGYSHSAETFLEKAILGSDDRISDWLISALSSNYQNNSFKADLLRLLSRQKPFTSKWRVDVIKLGLSSLSVEVRDAAIQAAESWEEAGAIQLLQAHKEPCDWLNNYTSRVIRDLTKQ